VPDFDEAGEKVVGMYGMIHDITATKEASQHMTRLANFDTLTGLANRLQFNESLQNALDDVSRCVDPMALMFLDIDHFKQVNDRHGHPTGDALLKEFAMRLSESVRPTDLVARLSGDEFVVLLRGLHSDEEPQFIARKILAAVQKPFTIDERFMQVSASIGIAMRRGPDESASRLMKRADEALYEAKGAGRNNFQMAS
jgi:diguanylate cyclase (GGDEF)-like protein